MDPGGRRFLWDALTELLAAGHTIVLTSHSMEECEALCTRLAIMVNGQFECIGSPQHLKVKFGRGANLIINFNHEADVAAIKSFVKAELAGSVLREEHVGNVRFEVPLSLGWSAMFSVMERGRSELVGMDDYTISQSTLEQVFLELAKHQIDEEPPSPAGRCTRCCCFISSGLCKSCVVGSHARKDLDDDVELLGRGDTIENEAFDLGGSEVGDSDL